MLSQRILIYIALLSTALWVTMLLIFVFNDVSWVKSLGLFTQPIKAITSKYDTSNRPGMPMMLAVWLLVLVCKPMCMLWLRKQDKANIQVFPKVYFINWICGMSLTVLWYFMFDREQHAINELVLGGVLTFSFRNIVWTCRRLELTKSEMAASGLRPLPADAFRGLNSYAIITSNAEVLWALTAAPLVFVYPIAYAHSSHVTEPIERGILSVETSSTIGIWLVILLQWCYTVLDFSAYRRYTKHLFVFHPGTISVMLATFYINYHSKIGVTPNNMCCLISAFVSAGAYILRRWYWSSAITDRKMT